MFYFDSSTVGSLDTKHVMDNTEDMVNQHNQKGNIAWFIPENNKLDA